VETWKNARRLQSARFANFLHVQANSQHKLPTPKNEFGLFLIRVDNFRIARKNEAARAADAAREVIGAVYGERLK
jgi:hypothetical protein